MTAASGGGGPFIERIPANPGKSALIQRILKALQESRGERIVFVERIDPGMDLFEDLVEPGHPLRRRQRHQLLGFVLGIPFPNQIALEDLLPIGAETENVGVVLCRRGTLGSSPFPVGRLDFFIIPGLLYYSDTAIGNARLGHGWGRSGARES